MNNSNRRVGSILIGAVFFLGMAALVQTVIAANLTSQVVVGNSGPSVSSVTVNNGSAIVLTANTTTLISVNATLSHNNGCGSLFGSTTILLYRTGVGSSSCQASQNNANCYMATAVNATSSCVGGTQVNTTTTFNLYYFAQATDSSSSFSGSTWRATVIQRDISSATSSADSSGVTLNTVTAINVTTSSVNYGTISAGTNTGSTNQTATTTNAGNSSTSLQVSALSTLTSGANSIATSSQRYATSTFTFPGGAQQLTAAGVTVSGFTLTVPTSTSAVQGATFWGLDVPGGTATGTYSGTNVFSALFIP